MRLFLKYLKRQIKYTLKYAAIEMGIAIWCASCLILLGSAIIATAFSLSITLLLWYLFGIDVFAPLIVMAVDFMIEWIGNRKANYNAWKARRELFGDEE